MDFVDKALARRLESAEEVPQVHHARILQKTRSEVGAAAEAFGGGHMVFAGLGSPVGRAVGMGLDRPMTAEDLDRIEAFYRAHHAPAQVDVCPLHDPALFEVMKQRGYAIAELNNVLWRRLLRNENFPAGPAEIEFRRARDDEGDAIADILALSFHEKVPVPEGFREMLAHVPVSRGSAIRGPRGRQDGGSRRGSDHSRAQGFCAIWSRDAAGISGARDSNNSAGIAHENRRGSGMRAGGDCDPGRHDFSAQCGASGIQGGVQQSNACKKFVTW